MEFDALRAAGAGETVERFESALDHVSDGERRRIALTTPPHGCGSAFLSHAEGRLADVERVRFSTVDADRALDLPGEGVAVVEDCHYLYCRRVGGFDALDSFLGWLATTDCAVLATWNRYAWRYLAGARDVEAAFTDEIEAPTLTAAELETLFETTDRTLPRFTTAEEVPSEPNTEEYLTVRAFGREVEVPVPWQHTEEVTVGDPREAFFEELADVSDGHPGIAETVWDRVVTGAEVSAASLPDEPRDISLGDDEAFLLWVLLSNGVVERDLLSRFVDAPDRALQALAGQDLAERENGRVAVTPAGVANAASFLERRRLVW